MYLITYYIIDKPKRSNVPSVENGRSTLMMADQESEVKKYGSNR